jgi:hypothetical protein
LYLHFLANQIVAVVEVGLTSMELMQVELLPQVIPFPGRTTKNTELKISKVLELRGNLQRALNIKIKLNIYICCLIYYTQLKIKV